MPEHATRLPPFSYRVLEELKNHSVVKKNADNHWLLAVSGGIDSMVLWDMAEAWSKRLPLRLTVAHVHHGGIGSEATLSFRRQAYELVARVAEERGQRWVSNFSGDIGTNESCSAMAAEEELREFRYSWLERWRQELQADFIVLAHHQEDQLETRLIRLIRGCGPEGLPAMKVVDGQRLRPLLSSARGEIEEYARRRGLAFIEDPSNRDFRYLRNWLRHEWLPRLEVYRSGASLAMHRSLELVAQALAGGAAEENLQEVTAENALDLSHFSTLSEAAQSRQIAIYLAAVGVNSFSRGQIFEVRKRLLSGRGSDSFRVAGCEWQVNAGQVKARPVVDSED